MTEYPNLKPFRPGQSGNPTGRPAIPEELRAIKALTKDEVARLFSKFLRANLQELAQTIGNKESPSLDVWLAAGILKGIDYGDFTRLAFMLERVVGKPAIDGDGDVPVWAETLKQLIESGITIDAIVQHLGKKAG